MIRSLYSGLSGLSNHEVQLDVIGNNIANLNTIGFKSGRVTFEEMLATTLRSPIKPTDGQGGQNPVQVGVGSKIGAITTSFEQGGLETTGNQTDLAIQGDGFFILSNGDRNTYSRDGSFQFDSMGRLVHASSGYVVQGKMADSTGKLNATGQLENIQLEYGLEIPAHATTMLKIAGNLDADAESTGTILETERMYAVEGPGHSSDINGLYAKGTTNSAITGMSVGSTQVTVKARTGSGKYDFLTRTYTYTQTDLGVGDNKFQSLSDLVDEINRDFGAGSDIPSMTAEIGADGKIHFTNLLSETVETEGGEEGEGGTTTTELTNNLTITSTNSLFNRALSSVNGDFTAEDTISTDMFAHRATSSDEIVNLLDFEGESLGLIVGDSITLDGKVGDTLADTSTLTIAETTTYGDLIETLNSTLSINNSTGAHVNSSTGGIRIEGDGGTNYGLSNVSVRAYREDGTEVSAFNTIFDSTPGNWSVVQEATDAEKSASITAYDSLGYAHQVNIVFTKDTAVDNRWTWRAEVPEPAIIASGGEGYVNFNSDGSLQSFGYDGGVTSMTFDPGTGAENPIEIALDCGSPNSNEGLTQFEAPSTAVVTEQDGYTMGRLDNVTFDQQGVVIGIFSNGETQTLAQIELADFANEAGLLRVGNNMYSATNNSGSPVIGEAGTSVDALISPGALELSNVDLSKEFANMITAQRGYQANARIITTTDDILEETVRLKT